MPLFEIDNSLIKTSGNHRLIRLDGELLAETDKASCHPRSDVLPFDSHLWIMCYSVLSKSFVPVWQVLVLPDGIGIKTVGFEQKSSRDSPLSIRSIEIWSAEISMFYNSLFGQL